MADYTTKDAVEYTMNGNTAEFKKAVKSMLGQKISDAMEIKKVEVASSFMSADNEGSQESDEKI